MFDLTTATKATERDFTAIVARLEQLDEPAWERPVRCDGWTIRTLARHLIGASRGQAEGLRRAAIGRTELATLDPPQEQSTDHVLDALRSGRDDLLSALHAVPDTALAGVIPLPFGLLPAPAAMQIVPLEYGFHRNDLEWALGNEEPLGDDIAAALLWLAPNLIPILAAGTPVSDAGEVPERPVAYRLEAPGATLCAVFDGTAWTVSTECPPDADSCDVRGDDSAVGLFIMGRIAASHPSLQVNDVASAEQFKRYFPGP
jgi:uncharacterized protein (TIGR03083 family)